MDKNTQNHKNARHRLLNLERETIYVSVKLSLAK